MSLQEELGALIQQNKRLTVSKIADDIGYSTSVVSTWLRGTYTGNIAAVDEAVKQYLIMLSEKGSLGSIETPFVNIKNSRTVFGVLRRTQIDHIMSVITGQSGMGKSRAVDEYADRNRSVVLIRCNITYNAKILVAMLHKRLGLTGKGSKNSMLAECVDALKGTDRLVIIDEADLLGTESLEMLRALHDDAKIGITLVGLPELAEHLRGSRGEFARLYTRIGGHAKLGELSETDTTAIVNSYIPNANGLAKVFFNLCRRNGRTLYLLIYNAIRVSQENKTEITPELVEQCAGMLAI